MKRRKKHGREAELELIWKENLAHDKIDVYEGNIQHAISCGKRCCTPTICDKNDRVREERQRHNIETTVKPSDANTHHIDSRIVTVR